MFLFKKSPLNPDYVDWGIHYPKFFGRTDIDDHSLYLNSKNKDWNTWILTKINWKKAEEHEIYYDNSKPVDDSKNGRKGPHVEFLDVGCGFGGLLCKINLFSFVNLMWFRVALSKNFPNVLSLGLEIRDKLVNYVGEKIRALRIENPGEVA